MDIAKVFTNKSESVLDLFQQPGIGYYIPFYQREYSWDAENIGQLMEYICSGVKDIVDSRWWKRSYTFHGNAYFCNREKRNGKYKVPRSTCFTN